MHWSGLAWRGKDVHLLVMYCTVQAYTLYYCVAAIRVAITHSFAMHTQQPIKIFTKDGFLFNYFVCLSPFSRFQWFFFLKSSLVSIMLFEFFIWFLQNEILRLVLRVKKKKITALANTVLYAPFDNTSEMIRKFDRWVLLSFSFSVVKLYHHQASTALLNWLTKQLVLHLPVLPVWSCFIYPRIRYEIAD